MISEKSFERGKNIVIHVVFLRHGEKGGPPDYNLTDLGKEQARDFGKSLDKDGVVAKIYTSNSKRAEDTGGEVLSSLKNPEFKLRKRKEISLPRFSEAMTRDFRILEKINPTDAAQWYMDFDKEQPDESTDSPIKVIAAFANILYRYLRMPERLYNNSSLHLINVTHHGLPEMLLSKILIRTIDGKDVVGFHNLTEIGGALEPIEAIDFQISTDNDGRKEITVNFRNQNYKIDLNQLRELSNDYIKNKYVH